jgi:hypothetical protein
MGTVLGISLAVGEFGKAIATEGDINIQRYLGPVCANLSIAFDTTSLALVLSAFIILISLLARKEIPKEIEDCLKLMQQDERTVERMEKQIAEQQAKLEAAIWLRDNEAQLSSSLQSLANLELQIQQIKGAQQNEALEAAQATAQQLQGALQVARSSIIRDTSAEVAGFTVFLPNGRWRVVKWPSLLESDDFRITYTWSKIYLTPIGYGQSPDIVLSEILRGSLFKKSWGTQINLVLPAYADTYVLNYFDRTRRLLLSLGWVVGFVVLDDTDGELGIGEGERVVVQ